MEESGIIWILLNVQSDEVMPAEDTKMEDKSCVYEDGVFAMPGSCHVGYVGEMYKQRRGSTLFRLLDIVIPLRITNYPNFCNLENTERFNRS